MGVMFVLLVMAGRLSLRDIRDKAKRSKFTVPAVDRNRQAVAKPKFASFIHKSCLPLVAGGNVLNIVPSARKI